MILYSLNSTPTLSDVDTIFSGSADNYIKKIIGQMIEYGAIESNQISYVLATAKHETGNFVSFYEQYNGNAVDYFIDLYGSGTTVGQSLGNLPGPHDETNDAYVYRGRGFVHITGRDNYDRIGDLIGEDLINYPDLAADPDVAAKIIALGMINGYFTGKKLEDYISNQDVDFFNARKIVNGIDQANLIANYAESYDLALESNLHLTSIDYKIDARSEMSSLILEGGAGDNIIYGGSVKDIIIGGGDILNVFSGNDFIDGGKGFDTVDYSLHSYSISANFSLSGAAIVEKSLTDEDELNNIEIIVGTSFGDHFDLGSNKSRIVVEGGG
ncbi:MAG: hypothetical protein DI586_08710, partial [Micavibrio aeruginosavorus]